MSTFVPPGVKDRELWFRLYAIYEAIPYGRPSKGRIADGDKGYWSETHPVPREIRLLARLQKEGLYEEPKYSMGGEDEYNDIISGNEIYQNLTGEG